MFVTLKEKVVAKSKIQWELKPCEAIKFRMEQGGHSQNDLAKLLGSRSRASEYISGKRLPSKKHIVLIHKEWGVPLSSLLGIAP